MAYAFNDDKSKADIKIISASLRRDFTIAANDWSSLDFYPEETLNSGNIIGIKRLQLSSEAGSSSIITTLVISGWNYVANAGVFRVYVYNVGSTSATVDKDSTYILLSVLGD